MTKEEAQEIIDNIAPDTVIDDNWTDYLLSDKELITLTALTIVTDKCWIEILAQYEGVEINIFQTKIIENYVGKTLLFLNSHHKTLIISQSGNLIYYYDNKIQQLAFANIESIFKAPLFYKII